MSSLQDVYDQWQNNAEFRAQFKKNPEEALKNANLKLNPEDFSKIHGLLNQKNQDIESDDLDGRISK